MDMNSDEFKSNSSFANGSEDTVDDVVASIKRMLDSKSPFSSECNIYKVTKSLHSMNPKAYTPQVISIGPLHHGGNNMTFTKEHKLIYLQTFFHRTSLDPEVVVREVRSWEKRARNFYAEPIKMNSNEFVELILLDGCFVVEYFIRWCLPHFRYEIDQLFRRGLRSDFFCDLIKLENQLPFFVLEGLYQLTPIPNCSFTEISCVILGQRYHNRGKIYKVFVSGHQEDHFVNLLWLYFIPDDHHLTLSHEQIKNKSPEQIENCVTSKTIKMLQPPTATELYEAGVIFKKAENKCIGDVITFITFKNGVLEIPHIPIFDDFETYLRNLIAFEQCHPKEYYVSTFAMFMDGLINTDKDVSLLMKAEIISNYLGSNEDVSKLFNNLCKHIQCGEEYYFNDICEEMYKYCKARRHHWMALLRRNYFNTPWASISFVAAAILLVLTFIQTIFSGLCINK